MLKPQDVLCACKIYSLETLRQEWSYEKLAQKTGLSQGEAHNAVERCHRAQLITPSGAVARKILRDVLAVALPRMCFVVRGGTTVGWATGVHAPPLVGKFGARDAAEVPAVWPDVRREGMDEVVQGWSLEPVYPSVPVACLADPLVYELLSLVDVVRVGGAADRQAAVALIDKRLGTK